MQYSTSNNSAVAKDKSNVANDFQSFVTDVEELIKSTAHATGEDLHKAKAKLQERIASAKTASAEAGEAIVSRTAKVAESTNEYVHQQPWNAISAGAAVGAALGVALGYLLTRR